MNILLIPCFFVYSLFISTLVFADNEAADKNEQAQITLNANAQHISGIVTTTLIPADRHAEYTAYGKAINIQALFSLHNRYLQALTERSSAKARYYQAEQSIHRQQYLFRSGVSSKRSLQEQQAQWQSLQAQVKAADFQVQAIQDEALLTWGKTLSDWAMATDDNHIRTFLSGKKKLVQITLPADKQLADTVTTIYVNVSGKRANAHPAQLISKAVQTENLAQGESYYFQTDDPHLIAGMNITVWLPEQGASTTGVIIPKSALVWYLEQALVYVKTDAETFSRRTIDHYIAVSDGYFIANTLKAGDEVVTLGAQILLSEEMRGQIPKEDDD